MALPIHVRKYFWDIDPQKANPKLHPEYYIKRVLELGDQKAVYWAIRTFGKKRVSNIAKRNSLSPKSRNFWQRVFK